mgnify:FL=1
MMTANFMNTIITAKIHTFLHTRQGHFMAGNKALQRAAKAQQDEFYTSMSDIQEEMYHYKEHFRGAKILCNCDDPYESQFFYYFAMNFNFYGLAKLTATCYAGSPIAHQQLTFGFDDPDTPPRKRKPYCAEITDFQDYNGDTATDFLDLQYMLTHNVGSNVRELQGDGDFRSPECVRLLEDADIVITNPPHSLLREYIAMLMKYGKKFLILGNINAVTYKEIFPLFMHNKMWMGLSIHSGDRKFYVPEYYPLEAAGCGIDDKGRRFIRVKGVRWFTNLAVKEMREFLPLFRKYSDSPEAYPHYDNYDAIEVSRTDDIPCDYDGVMGVPITFMDKYNPEQFEILGITEKESPYAIGKGKHDRPYINGKRLYARILIRKIAERTKIYSIIHHGK